MKFIFLLFALSLLPTHAFTGDNDLRLCQVSNGNSCEAWKLPRVPDIGEEMTQWNEACTVCADQGGSVHINQVVCVAYVISDSEYSAFNLRRQEALENIDELILALISAADGDGILPEKMATALRDYLG